MSNKLCRAVIITLSLLLSVVLHHYYVSLASPQVPYMDTMTFLVQIEQIRAGEISWLKAYGSGEHRGFLYPLITFIEWFFWGLDVRVSTALTGVVVAATFFYWLRAYLISYENMDGINKKNPLSVLIVCFLVAAIVVSPAGFELWTLDLGFAQLFKNLMIVNFLYLLAIKRSWEDSLLKAILFGVYGGSLILFATYGWSYSFFIASLFILILSLGSASGLKMKAVIVIAIMFLAQILYVYNGHGVFSSNQPTANSISLLGLIYGVLYGAGSVFMGGEVIGKISLSTLAPLVLGFLILVAALLALIITLIERTREKIFFSGLLMFSLTVLAGVALARGFPVFTNVGASRYFVDYIWLLLGPLAIVFTAQEPVLVRNIPHKILSATFIKKIILIIKIFVTGLFLVAVVGHAITWKLELNTAPYRAAVFKQMANVYRNGVTNESDAALLQSPFLTAQRAVNIAQENNLSVLRDGQCTLKTAGYLGDWYPPENDDLRWLKKEGSIVLSGCATDTRVKGYIPDYFSSRNLRITYSGENQVVVVEPGKEFLIVVTIRDKKPVTVKFELDTTTLPASQGINADTRELGLLLTYIGE